MKKAAETEADRLIARSRKSTPITDGLMWRPYLGEAWVLREHCREIECSRNMWKLMCGRWQTLFWIMAAMSVWLLVGMALLLFGE